MRAWLPHVRPRRHVDVRHKVLHGTTVSLPKDDPLQAHAERVHLRAGSIAIWNSALVHANFPNDGERMRFVMYVKMAPADDDATAPLPLPETVLPAPLTPLGRRLHGLAPWDGAAADHA